MVLRLTEILISHYIFYTFSEAEIGYIMCHDVDEHLSILMRQTIFD